MYRQTDKNNSVYIRYLISVWMVIIYPFNSYHGCNRAKRFKHLILCPTTMNTTRIKLVYTIRRIKTIGISYSYLWEYFNENLGDFRACSYEKCCVIRFRDAQTVMSSGGSIRVLLFTIYKQKIIQLVRRKPQKIHNKLRSSEGTALSRGGG